METLQKTKKVKKKIIIFEVNDEKTYDGTVESSDFKDFIRSLGFLVTSKYKKPMFHREKEDVQIDGHELTIDYSKASYFGKSAYATSYSVRKDRHILIYPSYDWKNIVAKVKFNVEIDRDLLHSKIQAFINLRNDVEQSTLARKANTHAQLKKIQKHFYSKGNTKNHIDMFVEKIWIENGEITFHSNYASAQFGTIKISAETGKFIEYTPFPPEPLKSFDGVREWLKSATYSVDIVDNILKEIQNRGPLDETCKSWAKTAHHEYVTKTTIKI